MKKLFYVYGGILLLGIALLLQTCVDPIDFERRQQDDFLVVDGKVNLLDSVQTLRLTRTAVLGRSARFPPEVGAQVTLWEDGQLAASYVETEEGVYTIFRFKPQLGKRYHIEIQLASGERYASLPDLMPAPVQLDSTYFTYNGDRTMTIYARASIPAQGTPPYLRWRLRHVYQITDQYCGGLDDVKICYYETNRSTDNQLVPLLDGGEVQPGTGVTATVVEVPVIDSIFGEVTYFTVFQESLSADIFQYWQKVNTLITQTGSLFDAPPGQIRGNVYNVADPDAPVLGVFYAAAETFTYLKTVPGDFAPLRITPYCGFPGLLPTPFPYPQCCFCAFGIPRPDYWQ